MTMVGGLSRRAWKWGARRILAQALCPQCAEALSATTLEEANHVYGTLTPQRGRLVCLCGDGRCCADRSVAVRPGLGVHAVHSGFLARVPGHTRHRHPLG